MLKISKLFKQTHLISINQNLIKSFSTNVKNFNEIDLKFDRYLPSEQTKKSNQSLVILHGLLGSKQNWRALGKSFAQKLGVTTYALDLRNHGDSAHDPSMTYNDMAQDVEKFIKTHQLNESGQQLMLMGHSMGGRVAMEVALNNQVALEKLVLVDISPLKMDIKSSFEKYLFAMKQADDANLTKQSQADEILQQSVSSIAVRQFLLTNYKKNPATGIYKFRNPLDIMINHLDQIGTLEVNSRQFNGPTLFVRGTQSNYLNPSQYDQIQAIFSNSQFEDIDAGHWVHSEKPKDFVETCMKFLTK